MKRKYTIAGVNLEDWDAVAEVVFSPFLSVDDQRPRVGQDYYAQVMIPDERIFLLTEALNHLRTVEPGVVTGERVEFIVDGKACVEFEEWQMLWEDICARS